MRKLLRVMLGETFPRAGRKTERIELRQALQKRGVIEAVEYKHREYGRKAQYHKYTETEQTPYILAV